MTGRVSFPRLDIVKLVLAVVVVGIHADPLSDIGSPLLSRVVEGVECAAVPFFFIASGFLCFRGLGSGDFADGCSPASARVRRTVGRQLALYATWSALLLPLALLGAHLNGWGAIGTALRLVRGLLLVGENPFTWPLWYLLASAVSFSIVYCLLRVGGLPGHIVGLSAAALLAGFALNCLQGWDGAPAALSVAVDAYFFVFGTVRNGLFEGFFYVSLGMAAGFGWGRRPSVGLPAAAAGLVAGLLGCILVSADAHLPFCALYALSSFSLCVRREAPSACPWARRASTVVYLVHMVFIVVYVYVLHGYGGSSIAGAPVSHGGLFVFAVVGSLLTAAAAISLSRKVSLFGKVFGI